MAGDVESLDAVRRLKQQTSNINHSDIAALYVARAEEALALMAAMPTAEGKTALCRISETWLSLAEAELSTLQRAR